MENRDDSRGSNESDDSIEIIENKNDDDICELEHLRKLFIGGLAPYTMEDSLRKFYGQFGKVVDAVVMKDQNTKRSRGFGFITFTKAFMVDKAQANRPHVIDGKSVEAKRALPRPEREAQENKSASVKKLFVGGLKDNHDEQCLEEYFSKFGKVVSVKILSDKTTGKRRGFAFIEYDDYDAVDKAILQKTHSIKYVVVDVKKSVYSKELQKRAYMMHNSGDANNMDKNNPKGRNNMPPQQAPPQQQQMQPPPNYNQWGPPAPVMPPQNYGGYQQPPMPPQQQPMPNWNYQPAPNAWNGPPQQPGGPPPPWNNQWGAAPPAGPPGPQGPPGPPGPPGQMPPNQMAPPGTQPPPTWQQQPMVPPTGPPPASGPPPRNQQPPVQPQAAPQNFGTGYQQGYSGGPTKHQNNMSSNRMNPYSSPQNQNNSYNNTGYGGYNNTPNKTPVNTNGTGPANKSITAANGSPSNGKYRR